MTTDEVIQRLREAPNRKEVARLTGIPYGYLSKLVYREVKKPGSPKIDVLRDYFERTQ